MCAKKSVFFGGYKQKSKLELVLFSVRGRETHSPPGAAKEEATSLAPPARPILYSSGNNRDRNSRGEYKLCTLVFTDYEHISTRNILFTLHLKEMLKIYCRCHQNYLIVNDPNHCSPVFTIIVDIALFDVSACSYQASIPAPSDNTTSPACSN